MDQEVAEAGVEVEVEMEEGVIQVQECSWWKKRSLGQIRDRSGGGGELKWLVQVHVAGRVG